MPTNALISNVTAVLMDKSRTVLPGAYVLVGNGKIAYVGQNRPRGFSGDQINGHGMVLLPGFVNAHTHVPMTAMRGYGGSHSLQAWLNDYIFPAEAKWDDRAIRACTDLGLAEMIASGVTTICDMYMNTHTIAQAVADAGMSANLGIGAVFLGTDFSPAACNDCALQESLFQVWHGYDAGRILVDSSLHAEYTSCPGLVEWIADFAKTNGLGINVHVSETQKEHEECKARRGGLTPIQYLEKCGALDVRVTAAHCVWTTPEDWAIMAAHGAACVHNPASNLKLGSGVAPIPAMKRAGVNIALGTDGVSSHNATDFFFDVKLAAILHNGVNLDPLALTAWDALEMGTVNGGKALGRKTGRIAVGYDADLILVDFSAPNLTPCHDVAENLTFSANGSNVVMNMCRGKVIYKDGQFLTIDIDKTKRELTDYVMPKLFDRIDFWNPRQFSNILCSYGFSSRLKKSLPVLP